MATFIKWLVRQLLGWCKALELELRTTVLNRATVVNAEVYLELFRNVLVYLRFK
jgi:hypothetical protein